MLLSQPRLGPKPFTSSSGEISFDKVFSVPAVPGGGDSLDAGDDEKLDEECTMAGDGSSSGAATTVHEDDEKEFVREKVETPQGNVGSLQLCSRFIKKNPLFYYFLY